MTELRRWEEEGATPAELDLLRASRNERPPRLARARVMGTLGATGAAMLASTSTAGAAATGGSVTLVTKIVALSLIVGGTAAGGLALRESARVAPVLSRPAAPSRPERSTPAPAPTHAHEAPPVATREEPQVPLAREALAAPTVASSRSAPSRGPLWIEVLALERARNALAAHDPAAALRALDSYRAEAPHGELGSEEMVLRIQALIEIGARSEAAVLARIYANEHPDSPYASRVGELVQATKKP